MSKTLNWIRKKIHCPHCWDIININIDICQEPLAYNEKITGGERTCPNCKRVITDQNLKHCHFIEE